MSLSPARLSTILRGVSARVDASKNPSRSAVARELRRVLASMEDWTFEIVQDGDQDDSAPTFLVTGTDQGQPFECKLGVELDDRNFDFEHVSGVDFSEDPDKQAELLEALYASQAYKQALAQFES